VLVFGSGLGLVIALHARSRSEEIWPWVFLATIFVALFLHRLSLVYTLSESTLRTDSWWGLGRPETISLSAIDRADVTRSMAMSLVGCGHIVVRSLHPDEGSLTLLAQPDPQKLADALMAHNQAARKQGGGEQNETEDELGD
jgi:hypothetical protein